MASLLLAVFSTTNSTFSVIASTNDSFQEFILKNYVTHGPIYIDYDDNFTTPYGFPGSGTAVDPYRIENYNITVSGDYPILFSGNNTKHFVIQNCYLKTDTNIGIYLGKYYEMGEGTVNILDNIIITEFQDGIQLYGGNYSEIKGNTIITNDAGIYMEYAEYSVVSGNIITPSDEVGIYLGHSPNSTISRNNCTGGTSGIELYDCSDSSLSHNNFSSNDYGIYLNEVSRGNVSNNILLGNSDDGISTNHCYDTVFTNNLLQENTNYGIYLNSNSDNNILHHNAFIDNNMGGTSQAFDNGANNVWYETATSEGNYWSEWVSGSYSIDGIAGSVDPYPLSSMPVIPEYSSTYIAVLLFLNFLLIPVIRFVYRKKKR